MIDTHCHIHFRGMDADREAIIARCREKGMILNLVGTQKDTSKNAVELARQHDWMYASLGTHPNHLFPTYIDEGESQFMSREEDFDEEYYESLYQSAPEKIIAIGETGLDLFHVPKEPSVEVVLEKQKKVFLKHVAFAKKHDLPLVIHVRDHVNPAHAGHVASAHDHLISLLKSELLVTRYSLRGTVHCYTSNWTHAQEYLKLGLYIGFTGVITFPAKKTSPQQQNDLLEVVEKMPLDRILIETDAPYLAPQAHRGERCEPWMVEEVIKKIAELREISVGEVEEATTQNALTLFSKIVH